MAAVECRSGRRAPGANQSLDGCGRGRRGRVAVWCGRGRRKNVQHAVAHALENYFAFLPVHLETWMSPAQKSYHKIAGVHIAGKKSPDRHRS